MKTCKKQGRRAAGLADFELVEVDGRWGYTDKKPVGVAGKGKKLGIGKFLAERIRAGYQADAILATVGGQFPESRVGRPLGRCRTHSKSALGALRTEFT